MRTKSILNKNGVTCNNKELLSFIARWTRHIGFEAIDFPKYVALVGIPLPVTLSSKHLDENSFTCIAADGKQYCISLEFGNHCKSSSKLHITEGIETKSYLCFIKSDAQAEPEVSYLSRVLEKDGKKLNSNYGGFFCGRTLKFDAFHKLIVNFSGEHDFLTKTVPHVMRNCSTIENYLFELTMNVELEEIYDKMLSFLGIDKSNLAYADNLLISFESEDTLSYIQLHHRECDKNHFTFTQ